MVYTSKLPTKHVANNVSVFELLFDERNQVPEDRPIFVDLDNPSNYLTYGQLRTQILKAADGFKREFDLKKGDVVAICSPNHIYHPVIFHGAICAGGATSCIDDRSSPEILALDLDVLQPKVIVCHKDTYDKILKASKIFGLPESNILIFDDESIGNVRTVNSTLLSGNKLATPYPYNPEELKTSPAYLIFTSGTNGQRKAVMMTQSIIYSWLTVMTTDPFKNMRAIAYTKFYHASAILTSMHLYILTGTTNYVLPIQSLERICKTIEKYKISTFVTQPFILSALAKNPIARKYDLTSIEIVICCGSALNPSVARLVSERIGMKVINLYGMTEVPGIFKTTPDTSLAGSIGHLSPGMIAKVVDENGEEVKTGEIGELWVHGPTVTPGYYRNPEVTATVLDADGFIHTGDLVRCDEDGMFFYVDRASDLIKFSGRHICPGDVEKVLNAHPKVFESAVVGVYSHEEAQDYACAYVCLVNDKENYKEVERELLEYTNVHLEDYQKLRGGVVIVKDFPRTAIGKIQRRLLRLKVNASSA